MRVLVDVNVVLDVLADRAPFADASQEVLRRVEQGTVEGVIAAHSVTILHDLLRQHLTKARARRAIGDVLQLFAVVPVDADRLREALALDWRDFEDALQATCAAAAGARYVVTRDQRGFRRASVPPITPAALLATVP